MIRVTTGWKSNGTVTLYPSAEGLRVRVQEDGKPDNWVCFFLEAGALVNMASAVEVLRDNPLMTASELGFVWADPQPGGLGDVAQAGVTLGLTWMMDDFDSAWRELSAAGACDAIGGQEYMRVLGEWIKQKSKEDPWVFIRWHSNLGSTPP